MGPRNRCFLALKLPRELTSYLSDIQLGFRNKFPDLKWVSPENIHLTLHFLGEINRNQMDALVEKCKPLARQYQSFSVQLGKIGSFPHWREPRIIWIALKGDLDIIYQIHNRTGEIIKTLGHKLDNRPFSPHITLARISSRTDYKCPDLSIIKDYKMETKEMFTLSEFVLYTSKLEPKGPIYTPYYSFQLESKFKNKN